MPRGLEVSQDGRAVALGGPKQRLVLAHLLTELDHAVPTDALITRVWGDDPSAAARSSLQSYISHGEGEQDDDLLGQPDRGVHHGDVGQDQHALDDEHHRQQPRCDGHQVGEPDTAHHRGVADRGGPGPRWPTGRIMRGRHSTPKRMKNRASPVFEPSPWPAWMTANMVASQPPTTMSVGCRPRIPASRPCAGSAVVTDAGSLPHGVDDPDVDRGSRDP